MRADRKPLSDLGPQELRDLLDEMSSLALDLAQHLEFSVRFLKRRDREKALGKACEMAHRLHLYPYEGRRIAKGNTRVASFGRNGLQVERTTSTPADDGWHDERQANLPRPPRPAGERRTDRQRGRRAAQS